VKRLVEPFVVYNIRRIYVGKGTYDVKIVLSADSFKNSHLSEMDIVDSDGSPIEHELARWGRKMNVKFVVGPGTADGVATIRLLLRSSEDSAPELHRVHFWIVK
jgi:hypothetical protein